MSSSISTLSMLKRNYKGQVPLTVERALDDLYGGMDKVLSQLATQGSTLSAQGERVVQVEKQASALAQPFINSNNTASPDPNLLTQGTGSGNGTVTSVALSVPSIFTVSGSPVSTTGTLSFSLNTQAANSVFAGPSSGGAVAPTFRSLVRADLPASDTKAGKKCNFSAAIAPTVNDDTTLGYSVGSDWYDTTAGDAYTCLSAVAGAAVWKKTTP